MCQGGDEAAGREVDKGLEDEDGEIVVVTEDEEAEGEEGGVAGEADESGARWGGVTVEGLGEAVDAVLEGVAGEVAVEEGVVGDLGEAMDEPETEEQAGEEGGDG